MQKCTRILFALLATTVLWGCGQETRKENPDEKSIRNIAQVYQEAYNRQDATKLSAFWAPQATFTNPVTGESAEGRAAIEKLFTQRFAQNKKKHVEIVIKNIEFLNSEEALETGVIQISAPDEPVQQLAFQVEFVKQDGQWLMNAIREVELQAVSSNADVLQDLAWLVGKWEDSDDNIQIIFDNHWDKHKNFITQYFEMKIFGQDAVEGQQIITWDPVKNRVRSWVFDSDGGFGEGIWELVGRSWQATMRYTLSDGRVASSKNLYTPVDDQSYTFASIEREVDGEILPDMDPVTVEKVK